MKHLRNFILLLAFVFTAAVYAVPEVSHPVEDHTDTVHKMVKLTVEVINKTASGTSVEGDKVFVDIYHHQQQLAAREAVVDSAGLAVFSDIPAGDHFQVLPRAKHNNMMYGGASVSLDLPGEDVYASVDVYDVSGDNSVITAGTHHLSLKIQGQSLVTTEFMQLVNATDNAVTSSNTDKGGKPKVIEVSLPAGFSELKCLQYFVESAIVVTEDGFYDTMAIPPGSYNVMFTYKMDLAGPVMDVQKYILMPTKDLKVFSLLEAGMLQGLGQPQGKFNMPDGEEAQYYAASSFNAGDKMVFQITGIEAGYPNKVMIMVIVAVFALLALFVVKRLLSSGKSRQKNAKE